MGVLGKDLFDIGRPRTHVKVQFGAVSYWVEDDPKPQPYGAVLTELLNYDVQTFEKAVSTLEQTVRDRDAQAAPQMFLDVLSQYAALPYCRFYLSDFQSVWSMTVEDFVVGEAREAFVEYIFTEGREMISSMREQIGAIRFVQERYGKFLTELFQDAVPEKKKGQRKKPLAQQIYENRLDAFVSGVSLGQSSEVDAPAVNIQYAVLELDEDHHELVEKLYFDRLTDFIYVEFMKGLQKGFVPKRCANCGRWFLQELGMTFSYCDQPAPGEESLTCRDVGSKVSFRAKVKNNEVWAVHQRAYKKYFARTKKGTMSRTAFEAWEREAERIREEALPLYKNAGTSEERERIVRDAAERLNRA